MLSTHRPLRYCVDWTEQAHHLSGPLGRALTDHLFQLGWITRGRTPRSVIPTPEGRTRLDRLIKGDAPIPSGAELASGQ